jgi:micrococcal nuclease
MAARAPPDVMAAPGRLALTAVVAVAVLAGAGCTAGRSASVTPVEPPVTVIAANAVVVDVIDGDTIDVDVDGRATRVRLIGIDTPETKVPDQAPECQGPEASAHTLALLPPGTFVRLERDTEPRDDYGRTLAYVHRATDGLFVNLDLVERGLATPLSIEPNTTHRATFVAAAAAAETAGRGLWGAC